MAKCVITGCGLDVDGDYYHGDLHEQGDQWIFNSTRNEVGEARRLGPEEVLGARCLHTRGRDIFERKGVFVIPKATSELNKLGQDYINESPF